MYSYCGLAKEKSLVLFSALVHLYFRQQLGTQPLLHPPRSSNYLSCSRSSRVKPEGSLKDDSRKLIVYNHEDAQDGLQLRVL